MKLKQKLTTFIILCSLMTGMITPRVSYAGGLPVWDGLSTAQQILTIIKEYGLDSLLSTLMQMAGAKVSNKILNKVNGGASGDSSQQSYITNFKQHFADLGMGQLDKFVTDLSASNNPFAQNIAQTLVLAQSARSGSGSGLDGFNLDKVVGSNWKDFSNDASIGGWEGILALTNPANTNIGSSMLAQQELAIAIETAAELEKIKLTSPGTTPQGKCNLTFGDYKNQVQAAQGGNSTNGQGRNPTATGGNTNTSGQGRNPTATGGNTNTSGQGRNPTATGGNTNTSGQGRNPTATGGNTNNTGSGNTGGSFLNGLNTTAGLVEEYGGCLQELINNPVGTVTSTLSSALDDYSQRLQNSDEIGEAIGGLLLSLVNTFITSGLSGLNADFNQQRDAVGGPEQLVSRNGQSIPWTAAPNTIVDMPATFQEAVDITEQEVTLLNQYVSKLTEQTAGQGNYSDALVRLDVCIPGPDYRYAQRLTPYFNQKINSMKRLGVSDAAKADFEAAKDIVSGSIPVTQTDMSLWIQDPTRNIPGAGIMQQQVAELKNVRDKYQRKKTDIMEKQSALNLLYKIEGELKTNMQELRPHLPSLPANIPFTNGGWARLTAAEKTTLVNWAKTISGTTPPGGDTANRDFAQAIIWNVWSNPDQYITNQNWDSAGFLKNKNVIRSEFNSIQNIISIPYTLNEASVSLKQLTDSIDTTRKLAADCETMRTLITNNRFSGAGAHTQLLAVLKANKALFVSDAVVQALDTTSILSTTPGEYPTSVNCTGFGNQGWRPDAFDWLNRSHGTGKCQQDAGISDTPAEDGGTLSYLGDNEYQTQPATDVWMVLDQDRVQQLFCGFNRYLGDSWDHATNIRPGSNLVCADILSTNQWYRADKSDIVGYLYGDSVD